MPCNFATKSSQGCITYPGAQTLDELDSANMKIPGKHMKISWLVLSRVGVHYLSSTFGSWTICHNHRKEFLDAWQVSHKCSHPDHNIMDNNSEVKHLVTMVMSVKLLQGEGKVVPISSKFCEKCFGVYSSRHSSKPGEKLVIVVPKPKSVPVTSPFCSVVNDLPVDPLPCNILPRNSTGVLAAFERPKPSRPKPPVIKEEPLEEDVVELDTNSRANKTNNDANGFTLKTELVIENETIEAAVPAPVSSKEKEAVDSMVDSRQKRQRRGRKQPAAASITEANDEDDDEDILSHDSDDDPSWAPGQKNDSSVPGSASNIEAQMTNFPMRKRKRIGPDEMAIGNVAAVKKKSKKTSTTPKVTTTKSSKKSTTSNKRKSSSETDGDSEDGDDPEILMDMSEEANRIDGGGGNDFHYYCKICQISFYKHTAFKHHVFNSVDLHKQLKKREKRRKDAEMEYECADCCIAFRDRKSHQNHMVEEHSDTVGNPFYCQKCNVYLKSESAFKSHNSKLHLERREKSYYCRECDDTFSCLVKHSLHIVVHRTWTQEEMGMQCRICGKVFTRNQTLPFHRHLATHDVEPETECTCSECTGISPSDDADDESLKPELDPLDIRATKSTAITKKAPLPKVKDSLLKKMQNSFGSLQSSNKSDDDEEEEDEDDQDALKPYECAICSNAKFSNVEGLEKHVTKEHSNNKKSEIGATPINVNTTTTKKNESTAITSAVIDEVTDEFSSEVANFEAAVAKTSAQNALRKRKAATSPNHKPQERNWQECPDRNWAAEFGYGGKTSVGPAKDLLSKMRLTFKSGEDDDEAADGNNEEKSGHGYDSGVSVDGDDKLYRTRGFKGTIKASLNRAPRTLSSSSLRTRKRMEALMKRAREFMNQNKGKYQKSQNIQKQKKQKANVTATEKTVTVEKAVEKAAPEAAPPKLVKEKAARPAAVEKEKPKEITTRNRTPSPDIGEEPSDDDDNFDGIIDDDDDDDTDGLLIPLENGWVCEKRLVDPVANTYSTHFWSPDGERHSSLVVIKGYGIRKKLKLNMIIFERALKNNPATAGK